jgi:hypothetical protein
MLGNKARTISSGWSSRPCRYQRETGGDSDICSENTTYSSCIQALEEGELGKVDGGWSFEYAAPAWLAVICRVYYFTISQLKVWTALTGPLGLLKLALVAPPPRAGYLLPWSTSAPASTRSRRPPIPIIAPAKQPWDITNRVQVGRTWWWD